MKTKSSLHRNKEEAHLQKVPFLAPDWSILMQMKDLNFHTLVQINCSNWSESQVLMGH